MSKEDSVSQQKSAIAQAQDAALDAGLGACYDQGALDQKGLDGTLSQADLDKAVSDALAAAKVDSDKALSDEHDKGVQAVAEVQAALVAMTAKEQMEEQAVADVKAKIDSVQASFDAIRALFTPIVLPVQE